MNMQRCYRWCAIVCAIQLLSLALIAVSDADAPPTVDIKNFMFQPTSIKLKAGSTLTWINRDEEPHTVTSDTGLFRSGAMDTNQSFSFKFDTPGTYRFVCSIHPQMVGTIVVE